MVNQWDVIVVGGGISGLSTAALLAHAGRRVLVLEERPILGGRALVVQQGGFTLNYGYHYVLGGVHSPHWRVLRRIGRPVPAVSTHPSGFYQEKAGLHRFPVTLGELLRTSLWSFRGRWDYVRSSLAMLRHVPGDWLRVPLDDYLGTVVRDEGVRRFLLALAQAIGFDCRPGEMSAGHWLDFVRLSARSGSRPSLILSWDRLFAVLSDTVTRAGGEVRLKARADRVERSGDRVEAIWSGGQRLTASAYVLAIPAQQLPHLLPDGFPGWSPDRLRGVEPTAGVSLDLGIEGDWHRHAAVDVPHEHIVIACHSLWDRSLAPPGHTLLQVMHFLTPAEVRDTEKVRAARDRMLAAVRRHYPGALERVVLQRWLVRPMLTGARHSWRQTWQDLVPVTAPGVRNLYLVSDTAAVQGELSNTAVSAAEKAADAILSRHRAVASTAAIA